MRCLLLQDHECLCSFLFVFVRDVGASCCHQIVFVASCLFLYLLSGQVAVIILSLLLPVCFCTCCQDEVLSSNCLCCFLFVFVLVRARCCHQIVFVASCLFLYLLSGRGAVIKLSLLLPVCFCTCCQGELLSSNCLCPFLFVCFCTCC